MNCPTCSEPNRAEATFCRTCGSLMTIDSDSTTRREIIAPVAATAPSCPKCATPNAPGNRFCKSCGSTLSGPQAPLTAEPTTPTATAAGAATAVMVAVPTSAHDRSSETRRTALLIAIPAVVIAAVGALLLLRPGSGDQDAAPPRVTEVDTRDPAAVASSLPGSPPTTVIGPASAVVAPTSVPVPPSTAAVVATTVPTTSVPPPTVPPATVAPTAPPATVAPASPAPPPPPVDTLVPGDLGLERRMTRPACDEQYITVVGSVIDPEMYVQAVGELLVTYAGSEYLKTAETCPSLRPSVDGNEIYVVYFGPFRSATEACGARDLGPQDAYVRRLSTGLDPTHQISC